MKRLKWQRIPYVFLLTIFWFAMKILGFDMSAGSILGIVLFIACVTIIVVEFMKSMDIGLKSFKIDLALSVFTTVTTTALITRYVHLENVCLADFMLGITVLIDAFVSPVCSYGMALRNISGNVGTGTNEEAL